MKGRELTEQERNYLEVVVSTEGMLMYPCKHCEEEFASRKEDLGNGFCGWCSLEFKRELADSHGLESMVEDEDEWSE